MSPLDERRQAGERCFDERPAADASMDDLDLEYVATHYLPQAVAQEVLDDNQRSLDQQLRSLRLLVGGTPTWGALLGLGRDPQGWLRGAYVQFLRIDGLEVTDPIRSRAELTGRLGDVLRRLDELLKLNVSLRTEVATMSVEARSPDYPVTALQEFGRNAVMHRRYEGTNAPVHVHWYSDRVEIRSPGGLYGQVTPEDSARARSTTGIRWSPRSCTTWASRSASASGSRSHARHCNGTAIRCRNSTFGPQGLRSR